MTTQSSHVVIAIDPGLNGAWAALTYDGAFLEAGELPRFENMVNGSQLAKIIDRFLVRQAVIERVHAMPKQGVASTFAFGCAYGIAIGVLASHQLPIAFVTPGKWKSHFRLGAAKDASVQRATNLYPTAADFLTLKKHHNRADAILLGRYFLDATKRGDFV